MANKILKKHGTLKNKFKMTFSKPRKKAEMREEKLEMSKPLKKMRLKKL